MLIKNDDQLWQLFHSLEKAEKRHLKMHAQQGAGRKHGATLQLLACFDGITDPEDPRLLRRLQQSGLLKALPRHKNRLYELILASQRQLHAGKSLPSELRSHLEDIEMLAGKGLVHAARKRLQKAKKQAIRFEKEAMLLELFSWEQKLFIADPQQDEAAFFVQIAQEEQACFQRLARQRTLMRLHEQALSLTRQRGSLRDPIQKTRFQAIISDVAMSTQPPKTEFYASALFLKIRGIHQLAAEEYGESWETYRQLIALWEAHPEQIVARADLYLSSFNNYLNACLWSKAHFKFFIEAAKKIRHQKVPSKNLRIKFDRIAYFQELAFRMNFIAYEASLPFIEELGKWLIAHESAIGPARTIRLSHNVMMFFFVHGKYRQAHRWLLKITHHKAGQVEDLRDFARIFQLILHFEIGNLDIQEYLLRAAYRYLKRSNKLQAFEHLLIDFMKARQKLGQVAADTPPDDYQALQTELRAIGQGPGQGRIPGLQEVLLWLESKAAGKEMGIFYAERVERQWNQNA